jgi:histidinol dehydrogenase
VFVSIAKTLASARVSIDMVAGPTELIVYANAVIKSYIDTGQCSVVITTFLNS